MERDGFLNNHTRKDEIALWQMYMFSAVRAIREAPESEGITLLQTVSGKEYLYHFCADNIFDVMNALVQNGDTRVLYLIHVWRDHTLDVPSYDLRRMLLELHPENQDALMLLTGRESFTIRSLGSTMT